MAPKAASTPTSNSGIRQLSSGESIIPASTRADGTVRKEIRVKPGYKPPEDVEVYKNRTAEAWKTRGKGGVPGAEKAEAEQNDGPQSAAAIKNAKRREARKKAAASGKEEEEEATGAEANGHVVKTNGAAEIVEAEPVDPEAEKAKEAKKLAKKLRQAQDLQAKKESGDSLLPEQFAKVIKIHELIRQLDNLGFDSEGVKKEQTSKHENRP
ncbi:hypothetical protein BDY17DRAFT_319845 [Neohortaea acidophila]|uniref:WIBG Mago-binding domain-containing protein n=1 Tax=Neohortaea acidophila TaxID=245834 RepID=A0A6A6Q6M4_9PEZI|nr:uncharacterized protein BDY17DRAFT_319845 [Neohortaea acidophila]KAF2487293.1 hypothetical protein BDY17DRAFT_319845 [Neohortaea acidophila]